MYRFGVHGFAQPVRFAPQSCAI